MRFDEVLSRSDGSAIAEELAALRTPEVTARLAQVGFAVDATTREALGTLLADDLARWRRVVREAGIQVN